MSQSSINGQAAPLATAVAKAAELLRKSRLTVVAGLGADIAGARAALELCERIGGVVDHMHAARLTRDLDVMREAGLMSTTPGEARIRGDVALLVGDGLARAGLFDVWPELGKRSEVDGRPRPRVLRVGAARPDGSALASAELADDLSVLLNSASLSGWLGALRARVKGRPIAIEARELDAYAGALLSASFGVAVWSAGDLDALTIETLCAMVKDLNATTRFAGLPLAPGDNAAGVLQVCGWKTGLPPRTSFARGFPEHDPWTFDADRLVESGEADCGLWISAYGAHVPRWRNPVPTIALVGADAEFSRSPDVRITVGRPGYDHDATDYLPEMAAFVTRPASRPSSEPSVARVIDMIAAALDGGEDLAPC